jgi:dCMP deaminase
MAHRPTRHDSFLAQAAVVADRSTCLRRHIGAILVDPHHHQISSGYNGAPAGQPHCTTCRRDERNIPSGEHHEMCRAVGCHAEANALDQAGRGEARGATLYLVSKDAKSGEVIYQLPCYACSMKLLNAGVARIVIRCPDGDERPYTMEDPEEVYLLRDAEMWAIPEEA